MSIEITREISDKLNNRVARKIAAALETAFLMLAGLYLLRSTEWITTFHLNWPAWLEPCLRYGMMAVAALRWLTSKSPIRDKLIAALMAAIYYMVYRTDGYDFLLYLGILTVGFIGIDARKILKTCLIAVGAMYCVAVVAGMLGVITNLVYPRTGRGVRSAWGICYPTDFASLGLFLLLIMWVALRKLPNWAMLCLCAAYTAVTWCITRSFNSTICNALFALAILYRMVESRLVERRHRLKWMKKGVDWLAMLAFPLCALCIFALMLTYARGMNIGYRVNALLSNRLKYLVEAWRLYGATAFGTPFEMNGDGFSIFPQNNYTFVDSSYPLIALRYGWVLFLALCLAWGWIAYKASRNGDRRLVLVLIIIAIHSIAEHHFLEAHFNIFIAMPLAACLPQAESLGREDRRPGAKAAAYGVTALILIAAAWLAGPALLSRLKTALEFMHLGHGEHRLRLACLLLGGLCGVGAVAWALCGVLRAAFRRSPARAFLRPAVVLALCAVVGVGGWLYAGRVVEVAIRENAALVEADREALEIAVRAATGKVYSGVLPEVYHSGVEGIRYAAFFEDDLARLQGDTVLMPASSERDAFFHCGCLYVPISEEHALYTSDPAVVGALAEAGYRATGYYSHVQEVDLAAAADRNALTYDAQIGLRLDGDGRGLWNGPYVDLYGGRYTATWELSLPEGADRDGTVCTLGVSTLYGEEPLLEKQITADRFDEAGRLSVPIVFTVKNVRGVSFEAGSSNGQGVVIEAIRYVRTPELDVHTFYDSRLRVVRQEYYNPDGTPAVQTGGYYSYDQDYDRYGSVSVRRFYGANGELALRKEGYAEVHWLYNTRKQVVREEFYDTQGNPVMISSRQAANEREYDDAGNAIVRRYYDTEGNPCVTTSNYAEVRRQFDDEQHVIREEYYGVDGAPMAQPNGYTAMEQEYDVLGNVVARRFLDGDRLVTRTDGYAEVRWQYNGQHQVIREAFYDTEGEPATLHDGYAADEREYDAAGNVTVHRYYGGDGEPILIRSGFAERHREYDARRQIIREAYFDTAGQPLRLSGGYASWEKDYDAYGSVRAQRYYDTSGAPVLTHDGYFEVRREFDEAGHVLRERYFDTQGAPVACAQGYAIVEHAYNGAGEVVEDAFYAADGSPAVIGVGYARITYDYDADRQLLLTHYLDIDGEPVPAGSGYLHAYLQSLLDRDITLFISVRDGAAAALTAPLIEDMRALGIQTDLRGRAYNSFYAVVTADGVYEDVATDSALTREGTIGDVPYAIASAGYWVGNYSSIMIDGVEYSKNARGMNIVVYDNRTGQVVDSVGFNTSVQAMTVTR